MRHRAAIGSSRLAAAAAAAALGVACVAYHPSPIAPAAREAEFRSRVLGDPSELEGAASRPEPARESWDLAALRLAALRFNPEIAVARARVEAARAKGTTASEIPNPTIGFGPPFYSLNPAAGETAWGGGVTVDFTVETAGKRSIRESIADRELALARADLDLDRWHVVARVRPAVAEMWEAERLTRLLASLAGARRAALAILRVRLDAGDLSRMEIRRADVETAQLELELETAASRAREARAKLAAALGLPESGTAAAIFDDRELDAPPPPSALPLDRILRVGLLHRADLRRSLVEYSIAEGNLELAVSQQYPDVHLAPGYLYNQGQNQLLLGISFELPIFNQHQGAIAEAEGRRRVSEASFCALQAAAIGASEVAMLRYEGALARLAKARELEAAAKERVRTTRALVDAGEEDRLALLGATIEALTLEREVLAALLETQLSLAAVEDAAQSPLTATERRP
jgi:outer membrane protein TolC